VAKLLAGGYDADGDAPVVSGVALRGVSPVVDAPSLSLALSVAQEVLQVNVNGREVIQRIE